MVFGWAPWWGCVRWFISGQVDTGGCDAKACPEKRQGTFPAQTIGVSTSHHHRQQHQHQPPPRHQHQPRPSPPAPATTAASRTSTNPTTITSTPTADHQTFAHPVDPTTVPERIHWPMSLQAHIPRGRAVCWLAGLAGWMHRCVCRLLSWVVSVFVICIHLTIKPCPHSQPPNPDMQQPIHQIQIHLPAIHHTTLIPHPTLRKSQYTKPHETALGNPLHNSGSEAIPPPHQPTLPSQLTTVAHPTFQTYPSQTSPSHLTRRLQR